MNEKDFAELAAGHALNSLSPTDEAVFRAALAEHPEWQRTVDADAQTAARLADGVADVSPPAGIRDALLAQIAGLAQPDPADRGDAFAQLAPAQPVRPASRSHHWNRLLFALAASVVLVVGLGFGVAALNGWLDKPAAVIALEEITAAPDAQQASIELEGGGTATAHWSGTLGSAVLVADGIATLSADQAYELWFVRADGPVSAGVFDAKDGDATAVLTGDMQAGDIIAVTIEQAGGSPSGDPTTDPIIVIPTA